MIIGIGSAEDAPGHSFVREPGFPYWTLAVMWSGSSHMHLAAGSVTVPTLALTIMRPRTPYRVELPDGGQETWALFTPPPAWEHLLTWPEELPGYAVIRCGGAHGEAARAAVREAAHWWQSGEPSREGLALNALERCLLLLALDRPGAAWAGLHPVVRAAAAILAPGPAQALSVSALARRIGCSSSHLAHLFREQIGESLLSWLEGRRLARAQELLLGTDWPVKRIASACGFADGEHLARRFRKRLGQSPGQWRSRPQR